jgi:hypothetical protein
MSCWPYSTNTPHLSVVTRLLVLQGTLQREKNEMHEKGEYILIFLDNILLDHLSFGDCERVMSTMIIQAMRTYAH